MGQRVRWRGAAKMHAQERDAMPWVSPLSESDPTGTYRLIGKSNPTTQILSLRRRSTLLREKPSEPEVSDVMGADQSTISRRKQAILNGLRRKLRGGTEFQNLCIKLLVASNLTDWLARLGDLVLGA